MAHPFGEAAERNTRCTHGSSPRRTLAFDARRAPFCRRSARGAPKLRSRPLHFGSERAVEGVIVNEAHRLHEGVHGGRTHELPAALLQVFRERDRFRRGRCALWRAGPLRLVAPDERRQRAVTADELASALCVVDDRLDLAAVADDARVREQAGHVASSEASDAFDVEASKRGAEALALGQDGAPAEPGLKPLEAQLLEQPLVITDRETPLGVVVLE